MDIRTDLSTVGKVINLPGGTRAGRLAVLPRGGAGLGPSDFVAYVYLELDADGLKALEDGTPAQAATLALPEDVARALLPASLLPSAAPVHGVWSIDGYEINAQSLGRMPYQVDEAIRVASGLVVIASTR